MAGQTEAAAALLDGGVDVNARDMMHRTAIHLACEDGEFGVAALLLFRGGDSSAVDSRGKSPLALCPGGKVGKDAVLRGVQAMREEAAMREATGRGAGAGAGAGTKVGGRQFNQTASGGGGGT